MPDGSWKPASCLVTERVEASGRSGLEAIIEEGRIYCQDPANKAEEVAAEVADGVGHMSGMLTQGLRGVLHHAFVCGTTEVDARLIPLLRAYVEAADALSMVLKEEKKASVARWKILNGIARSGDAS